MRNLENLKHKLKARHLQMIALGGVIGTGLFFGSGKSIHLTGPSIVLSYLLGGTVIYIILRALGEMTVYSPSSGAFSEYANRYVNHYAGFVAGWSAWFEYTVVCMVELTAVTIFLDSLIPGLPHWLVCLVLLILFVTVNLLSVSLFGEFEFWFAGIKIVTIVAMILLGVYLIVFKHGMTAEVTQYKNINLFFAGGAKGFIISLVIVVFSFGGSEFIGIAAGESQNPQKSVPRVINGVIIRIILFYILTMAIIILLYPYQKLSTHISPFVDVFQKIGLHNAAIIMNLVAVTAALSAFNSCLYAASRIFYNLANNGYAPKYFRGVTKNSHIPKHAILLTGLIIGIVVIINYLYPTNAIMYMLTIATSSILIVWFIILVTQIYFRKQKNKEGVKLSYKLGWFPYTSIFAMLVLITVLIAMTQMEDMRLSVYVAPVWILILSIFYVLRKKSS